MSFGMGANRVRIIAEALIFGGMTLGIVYYFGLKNESLLLSALIFGIYLVVSGRISEFKFMDLDVKLKNAENRPVDELTEENIPPESMQNFLFALLVPSNIEIPLVNEINSWKLNADPIKKEYVMKGTPRKQVLDKMDRLGLDAIPVVSAGLKYEGFIDRDT